MLGPTGLPSPSEASGGAGNDAAGGGYSPGFSGDAAFGGNNAFDFTLIADPNDPLYKNDINKTRCFSHPITATTQLGQADVPKLYDTFLTPLRNTLEYLTKARPDGIK